MRGATNVPRNAAAPISMPNTNSTSIGLPRTRTHGFACGPARSIVATASIQAATTNGSSAHAKAQREREDEVERELVAQRPADDQQRFAGLRQAQKRCQDLRPRAAVRAGRRRRDEIDREDDRGDDPVRRINPPEAPLEETARRAARPEPRRRRCDHHGSADHEEQIDAVRAEDVIRRRPRTSGKVRRLHGIDMDHDDHQRGDRAQRLDVPEHDHRFDARRGAPASAA